MNKRAHTHCLGLALGGGGVKGLGHIGLLKMLDQHGLRPDLIAGTSMGAIVAALYAHGLSGRDIEERVRAHIITRGERVRDIYGKRSKLMLWSRIFRLERNPGGLLAADGLFAHLFSELVDLNFEDLAMPLTVIATDFHTGEEYPIRSGPVLPAVRASIAVPGVFAPVRHQGRLLIDGGLVNNLPTSHVHDSDFVIASNVITLPVSDTPKTLEVIDGAINIMVTHVTRQALAQFPADILVQVDSNGIDAFDFLKIEEALARGDIAAAKALPELRAGLLSDDPSPTVAATETTAVHTPPAPE